MKLKRISPFILTAVSFLFIKASFSMGEMDCYSALLTIADDARMVRKIENSDKGKRIHQYLADLKRESGEFNLKVIKENWDLATKYKLDSRTPEVLKDYVINFFSNSERLISFYRFNELAVMDKISKTSENTTVTRQELKLASKKGQDIQRYLNEMKSIEPDYFGVEFIKEHWDVVLKHFPTQKNPSSFYIKLRNFFGSQDSLYEFMGVRNANRSNKSTYIKKLKKGKNERETIVFIFSKLLKGELYSGEQTLSKLEEKLKDVFHYDSLVDLDRHLVQMFGTENQFNQALYPKRLDLQNSFFSYTYIKESFKKDLQKAALPKNKNFKSNQDKAKKIADRLAEGDVPIAGVRDLLKEIYPRKTYVKFLVRHKRHEFTPILKKFMEKDNWVYELNDTKDNFKHLRSLMEEILGVSVGYGKVVRYILTMKLDEFNFAIHENHYLYAKESLAKADGVKLDTDATSSAYKDLKNDELVVIDEFNNPETLLSETDADVGLKEIAMDLGYPDYEAAALVLSEIVLRSNFVLPKIVKRTGLDQQTVVEILSVLNEKRELLTSLL